MGVSERVDEVSIYAHRGMSGTFPENTMTAFQAALDAGVEGIELDVQMSKDGHLVIIHDEQINRTTNGKGYVKDLTLDELLGLDAGGWFSSDFIGEGLPSLQLVLEWLVEEGNDLTLNIELKNDIIAYEGMERKVLDLIDRYQIQDRVIISSFNAPSLKKVKAINPNISVGYLIAGVKQDAIKVARDIGADAIHCQPSFALSTYGREAIEKGYPLRVYTVNERAVKEQLVETGVEVIMTDVPEQLK